MSQYPPPPPSYGAYDQPPPPGFGYPPGNQGPYYPQPGYPQPPFQPGTNPATCPPGPGGYYPGQPATQTIEKEDDSFLKDKQIFVEDTNSSSIVAKKCKDSQITPLHNSENYKPTILASEGERYIKSTATKQCDENQKSTTLYYGEVSQKHIAVDSDVEKHKLLAREGSYNDEESTSMKSKSDHLQHTTAASYVEKCKPMVTEHDIELNQMLSEVEYDTFNSEKFLYAENVDEKCNIPSPQKHKHQRQTEIMLGKNNKMHRLLNVEFRDDIYQPQFVLNNKQPIHFASVNHGDVSNLLASYHENNESDDTDCCNEEFCSGDCGKNDDSFRADHCEEDSCNDDCQTSEDECSRAAAVELGHRKYLLPKVLNSNCQPESFKMNSYRVITSQPTSYNWNDSAGIDCCEADGPNSERTGSFPPALERVYRNYLPQKVLNNSTEAANLKNDTHRVITAEPIPPNRHGEYDCCGCRDCCKNDCCKTGCYNRGCCKQGCCKQGCCKDSCCKQGCCKDSCCKDSCCKDSCSDGYICISDLCEDCCMAVCTCFCDCMGTCSDDCCDCDD